MSRPSVVDVDVVVAGAGPGGLRSAQLLHATGRSVAVLEARERVGGRLLSTRAGDHRFDLGATWFWPHEQRVAALVDELQLDVFDQHLDGDMMYEPSTGPQRISGNQLDVRSGRFVDGAQSLAEALARQLPDGVVRLDEPVRSIRPVGDRVGVRTDRSTWSAAHVILAVPPAAAVGGITIEHLDDAVEAVAAATPVWMGETVKVVAHYPRAFWRDAGLAGSAFSHVGPIREVHDMSGPGGAPAALFGFAQPAPGSSAPDRAAVLGQLSAVFGPEAAAPEALWIHDWRLEPFTTPSNAVGLADYSTYGHRVFQQPSLAGRLHWASTETSSDAAGHIEGALCAAERAVAAVIADG
jgi:monoamine oxidase